MPDQTPREQLAAALTLRRGVDPRKVADAVIAAGWRPPARESDAATSLIEAAVHLLMHGERAPGWRDRPNETWEQWSANAHAYLRSLHTPENGDTRA